MNQPTKQLKHLVSIAILFSSVIGGTGCSTGKKSQSTQAKNVILVIADGMGPQQLSLLYYFVHYSRLGILSPSDFAVDRIMKTGFTGLSGTEPYGAIAVDSAASATHLAIGTPSRPLLLGTDYLGNPVETIAEKAKKRGLSTGLVSDTRITHATPAAFAAHVPSRNAEDVIAEQLAASNMDVLYSAGWDYFIPKSGNAPELPTELARQSKRKDEKNVLALALSHQYQLAFNRDQMSKLPDGKVLGLFGPRAMPDAFWENRSLGDSSRTIPNLTEMTQNALERLEKNKKGFFLMVESGQIDWAGHTNDAGWLLHEMIRFNRLLNALIDYTEKSPETLLVVTADHETGSFSFGYHLHDWPKPVALPGQFFKDKKYDSKKSFVGYEVLDKLYQQKKNFGEIWTEFNETPKAQRTAGRFVRIFNQYNEFKLSQKDGDRILARHKNPFYHPSKKEYQDKTIPHVHEFRDFFYDERGSYNRLLASAVSGQQGIAWATTGHTATPVTVFALGPEGAAKTFMGYQNHPKLGVLLQRALGFKSYE